jgi:hypothetical protein
MQPAQGTAEAAAEPAAPPPTAPLPLQLQTAGAALPGLELRNSPGRGWHVVTTRALKAGSTLLTVRRGAARRGQTALLRVCGGVGSHWRSSPVS